MSCQMKVEDPPLVHLGDQSPRRYVILTTGRSGSNLLVAGLADHPSVRAYPELLTTDDHARRKYARQSGGVYLTPGGDAASFLQDQVYERAYPATIKAVGFKILFNQARDDSQENRAWQYLIDHREVRVIHLIRPNLLDAAVSYELARRTGEWYREAGAGQKKLDGERFTIPPIYCSWFFRRATRFNRWVVQTFVGRPMLTLTFHELTESFQSTMNRAYDFLDVERVAVSPRYEKQRRSTPQELVANYDELKRHFESTQFGWFF